MKETKDKISKISNIAVVQERLDAIYTSIERTKVQLLECLQNNNSIDALKKIKFEKIATDPLKPEEKDNKINFIEMLNQSFSDIVVFRGVEYLLSLDKYKGNEFKINAGAVNGIDIESETVVAECFSVVSVFNNQKIKKDSDKLLKKGKDKDKFIFFYSDSDNEEKKIEEFIKTNEAYKDITYKRLSKDLKTFE